MRPRATHGPGFFAAEVKNWDAHLATLVDFWSGCAAPCATTASLAQHAQMENLTPCLFRRWLTLFFATTESMGNAALQEKADTIALNIANGYGKALKTMRRTWLAKRQSSTTPPESRSGGNCLRPRSATVPGTGAEPAGIAGRSDAQQVCPGVPRTVRSSAGAHGHGAHRDAADAQALHAHHVQAHHLAHVGDLARLHVLQGKAQGVSFCQLTLIGGKACRCWASRG
jgi:hemoglobin